MKYPHLTRILVLSDFKTAQKKFERQGVPTEDILETFKAFKEMKDKVQDPKQRDIDTWAKGDWREFKIFVNRLKDTKSKTQVKKEQKVEGAELVAENEDYRVYKITNHKACMLYGANTKWCITQAGGSYWDKYSRKSQFYFILSKTLSPYNNKWAKIALQVEPSGNKIYWDATDQRHSSLPSDLNVPEFTPEPKERTVRIGKMTVEEFQEEYEDEINRIGEFEIQARMVSYFEEDNYDGDVTSGQDLELPYHMKPTNDRLLNYSDSTAFQLAKKISDYVPNVHYYIIENPDEHLRLSWSNSTGMLPYNDANFPGDAIIMGIHGYDYEEHAEMYVSDILGALGLEEDMDPVLREYLEETEGENVGVYRYTQDRDSVEFVGHCQGVYALYYSGDTVLSLIEKWKAEAPEAGGEEAKAKAIKEVDALIEPFKESLGDWN